MPRSAARIRCRPIWGNHDIAYLPERPWILNTHHQKIWPLLSARFDSARSRFMAAFAIDGWLCTHAGVSPGVAKAIPAEVIAAGPGSVAAWLNHEFSLGFTGPIFQRSYWRGGTSEFVGIFWFDPFEEMKNPSPLVGRQIFGHTPVPVPDVCDAWVNLNCLEDPDIWVFDTKKHESINI